MRASAGERVEVADEEMAEEAAAAGGVSVFPGWEFFTPVAGAENPCLSLLPRCALFVDEPAMVRNQIDRWWNKVEQRHERSGIGSLIRPEDIYLRPEVLQAALQSHFGLDLDQLGAVDVLDEDTTLGEIEIPTRPTLRFHGSIPALTEQLRSLMQTETRIVLAAPNQGEVERLATVLREYQIPYRFGSRIAHPGETMLEEASYLAGDLRVPVIVRTPIAAGVSFAEVEPRFSSAPTISPTKPMWPRGLRPSAPRPPLLSPTFAISRSATMWSTSSTASRSTRA